MLMYFLLENTHVRSNFRNEMVRPFNFTIFIAVTLTRPLLALESTEKRSSNVGHLRNIGEVEVATRTKNELRD
jgi:hypothetical protein